MSIDGRLVGVRSWPYPDACNPAPDYVSHLPWHILPWHRLPVGTPYYSNVLSYIVLLIVIKVYQEVNICECASARQL